jgi:hypothetical protein
MEVKKSTLKKRFELDREILRLLSIPMTKKEIRDKLDLSKSNMSYYLNKLELSGNIKRIGKNEVKVIQSSIIHPRVTRNQIVSKLNKRGHAHNFKVIFPQELGDLRLKHLIKNQIAIKRIQALKFGSLKFNYKRFTIWINKSTLTIYSRNSYYSNDALMSKFTALKDLDKLIGYLKDKFDIKGIYGIEIFREHYGLIFNEFAKWLLDKGSKMEIKDKGNKSILWVDDSKDDDIGLKEFESPNPLIINNADTLFESHLRTGWKVTPEFELEAINKLTNAIATMGNQLLEYKEQNVQHLALIQDYRNESKENKKFNNEIIKLINQWKKSNNDWRKHEVKQIKKELKQSNLNKWIK